MSDDLLSTTTTNPVQQTPENTTAPFEPSPTAETDFGEYLTEMEAKQELDALQEKVAAAPKPKKKRIRLTPKQRAAKIAAGWVPPGPRPKAEQAKPAAPVAAPVAPKRKAQADVVLKALVDKLVALENDSQYRGVWSHFFVHGGVYNGPKYVDELTAAIQYLISSE